LPCNALVVSTSHTFFQNALQLKPFSNLISITVYVLSIKIAIWYGQELISTGTAYVAVYIYSSTHFDLLS